MIKVSSLDAFVTTTTTTTNGEPGVKESSGKEFGSPTTLPGDKVSSGSPPIPPIPSGLVDLVDIVGHYLRTDSLCRENDLYLILRVCEYKGFCLKRRLHNNRYALFFLEGDIVNGRIPRSFFDTVRRTRQKLQQQEPSLRPDAEFYNARQSVSKAFRRGIVGKLED